MAQYFGEIYKQVYNLTQDVLKNINKQLTKLKKCSKLKKSDKHNCSTLLVIKEMQIQRINVVVYHLGWLETKAVSIK